MRATWEVQHGQEEKEKKNTRHMLLTTALAASPFIVPPNLLNLVARVLLGQEGVGLVDDKVLDLAWVEALSLEALCALAHFVGQFSQGAAEDVALVVDGRQVALILTLVANAVGDANLQAFG